MRTYLQKFQSFIIAEATVIAVVVLNAVALVASSSFEEGSASERICAHVDLFCVLFFIAESALKIRKGGMRSYWASSWNRFDFLIVIASLPVLIEPFIALEGFGAVLVLRLGRLFRLFRLMIFIPNLDHLATGLSRALKASVGVFFALLLFNLIFAVGASILFGPLAPEHFGNPLLSIYSTFKVFTVEGWYEIPDLIAQNADSDFMAVAVRIYFVLVVLIGGIFGLSLANAVFIDEMTMDNTKDVEAHIRALTEEVRELKEMVGAMARAAGGKRTHEDGSDP